MKLFVIEGPDASGKTELANRVVYELRAQRIDARAFHHPSPPEDCAGDPWLCALHYLIARSKLIATAGADEVIVADRWHWSSLTEGRALEAVATDGDAARLGASVSKLWHAEALSEHHRPLRLFLLDASDEVLDRRSADRGHEVTPLDRARRRAYRAMSIGGISIDTAADLDAITQRIVDIIRQALSAEATR